MRSLACSPGVPFRYGVALLAFVVGSMLGLSVAVARAASARTPVAGDVRSTRDGAPIPGVVVTLEDRHGNRLASGTSDVRGAFVVFAPSPGRYRLIATAKGFHALAIVVLASIDARSTSIRLSQDDGPHEIGGVVSRAGTRSDAEPSDDVSQKTLASEGALRASDALARLGGVTVTGDAASPGGDAYVSLRGLRPSESRTFLDGHPIGPIGVAGASPDADGTIAGFNFQDAPFFALRDVVVSFGAEGSTPIDGDAIGGTIDLRTLDPTRAPEFEARQGIGTQGRAFTAFQATGMPGKFGYAFVYGVEGTYGNFPGATIAQTGLRGTDFTRATLAGLTYHVSGDYDLRNELAKLTYDPSASTKLTLSAYGATSWADKTGEGDNDDNPYAYTLANAPIGASASCPHGVVAATDSGPSCLTPAAYASGASGPAGGGPDAWQALRNEDYDIRASTNFGKNTLAIDAFTDAYVELYHRGASVVNGPLDAFLDRWSTQGARASDEIGWRTSSLGFGFAYLRQVLGGDATSPDGSTLVTAVPVSRIEARSFVSEIFAPSPRLTVRGFADVKRSNGDVVTRVDPQAALTYRFAPRDTVRLAAGRATDEPSLQTDRVDLLPVGALNPDCGAIAKASPGAPATVVVGSGPAPGLAPETGTDIEAGYEHRFGADATLGLTAYDTNVTDRIVTGAFGAGTQLSPATLAPFFGRIADFCGAMPAPGAIVFGLNRAFNVASARLRGFDMSGRVRVVPHLAFDYAYDVQSSVLNGLPPSVLASDPTLVNGLQVFDVPLHTATLGVEFATATGMTLRLDGHAVGPNNPQQLPGYAYADASLTQTVSGHVVLRVAVTNLFDGHAQAYGFEGLGLPYATNALNAAIARPFLQPDNERYGLAPTSLTASVSLRL